MPVPTHLARQYLSGAKQFSYCFQNYGTSLGNGVVDDLVNQAFSLWTSAPIPVQFYRKDQVSGQCDADVVFTFLKADDSKYQEVFGGHASDEVAGARDEYGGGEHVAIYVKDSIKVAGLFNWTNSFFSVAIAHEIGHALGLDHSAVVGAIMYPDVSLSTGRLTADDIAKIQGVYHSDANVRFRTVVDLDEGDAVDNHKICFMPNFRHDPDDFSDFFLGANQDIFLIKIANTGSGRVEVHSLSANPSKYTDYRVHAATPLPLADARKFRFLIGCNGDLFCLKISETSTGKVEIFSYTAASNYQTQHVVAATPIPIGDAPKFQYLVAENGDLFCIKTSQTGTGKVEAFSYTAGSNYQRQHVVAPTPITTEDGFNFRFLLAPSRELFGVKIGSTGTNTLEVHSLTPGSNYRDFHVHSGTPLPVNLWDAYFGLVGEYKLICVRKFGSSGAPSGSRQLEITIVKYH